MPAHAGPDKGRQGGNRQHMEKNPNRSNGKHGNDNRRPEHGVSRDDARRWAVQYRYTGYTSLPSGVRKNMTRGKPLPQGIAKRPVPPQMSRHLPHRDGYAWYRTGNDLVLIAVASGIVADIMVNVFR